MKFIRTNIENLEQAKTMVYKLTKSSGMNAKDVEGVFPVHAFLIYEEENSKGELQTVLSIISERDGESVKLSTISKTFLKEFNDITDIMLDEPFSIIVVHGKSKSGRDYVSCELYC